MLNGFIVVIVAIFILVLVWHKLFNGLIGISKPLSAICETYSKSSQFIANLVIGLIVLFLLTFFKTMPWLMDAEDANLDLAMQFHQDDIPSASAKDIPPFVFLDIDDQTHKLWGEPLFTSRKKVTELIDVAVKGGARLVVVDLDLSQKTSTQTTSFEGWKQYIWRSKKELASTPYDQALYDYIANYKTRCEETGCPPLILKRVFRPLPVVEKEKNILDWLMSDWFRPAGSEPIRESRPSFLDEAVAKSAPYVQWAAPLWVRSPADGVIRRGWLWQPICTEKQPEMIPSTQLLAAAMIRFEAPQVAQESINNALTRFKLAHCSDSYRPQSVLSRPVKIADELEIPEGAQIRQRIMYQMGWQSPQNLSEKWMRYFLQDLDKEALKSKAILTVLSAQPYLDSPKAGEELKDKIVLIGSSYSDNSEMPITPLGAMPSGLIIINAIHSLLQYGESQPPAGWDHLVWAILLIIVISIIFIFIKSFWVVVFLGISVILIVPVSAFLLGEGVWINLALALLAVHVHQIAANYREKTLKLKWQKQETTRLEKELKSREHETAQLAHEITRSLAQSLTKPVSEILTATLPKTMDQFKQRAVELAKFKVPLTTPPKKSEVVSEQKPSKSILDKLMGSKQRPTESKEANEQKPSKPSTDETGAQISEQGDQKPSKPGADEMVTPISEEGGEQKPSKPGTDETSAQVSEQGDQKPSKPGADETPTQYSDGSIKPKPSKPSADGTADQVSRPSYRDDLATNMFLGLGVALVLLLFSRGFGLMDTKDASMDWLMQVNQNLISPKKNVPSIVLLDIDDETYHNWGEPLFTPRQRLQNMIKAAVEAKARLVIVDLEVSHKTPVEDSRLHPDDQALKTYLADHVAKCKNKTGNFVCTRIILRRTFSTQSSTIPRLRASFLDEVVAQAAPYVQWASTQFDPANDQVVRRWKLWQPACTSDKQPIIIPSLELLAMAQIKDNCTTADLQKALRPFQPKNCGDDTTQPLLATFNFCGLTISTTNREEINNQRIRYRISWLVDDKPPILPYVVTDESDEAVVLAIFSAQPYAESSPQASLDAFADSIVVIGAGSYEGRNIYSTPLGDMPGALITANALYSLLQNEKIDPHPIIGFLIGLLTTVIFIIIISVLFAFFPSVWGRMFWGVVVILGLVGIFWLLPISMVIFCCDTWLNFVLPLIVIIIYQVVIKKKPLRKKTLTQKESTDYAYAADMGNITK
jgi:CHASE2 domain-containing sensor protein